MSAAEVETRLVAFLESIRRPDVPAGTVSRTDDLVETGLIDSLAVLEIVLFLETEFGIDFAGSGVEPERLRSVSSIVGLIEERGESA